MIAVVVEGATDVPFVQHLCKHAGFELALPPIIAGGKSKLDEYLPNWANAGKNSPWLVLRDLDNDAVCAASWLNAHAPRQRGKLFALRLAVRDAEAWFLADREHAAKALRVPVTRIPINPELCSSAKAEIVAIARHSGNDRIRRLLVPGQGVKRKIGAGYEGWLIEHAQTWRIDAARRHADSLDRAVEALKKIRSKL